ncbi:MAG: VOC family protein, partial [Blastocatellia bacterium]
LELIAFERLAPGHRWWQWIQNGGGLTDVCLRTDDLAADVAAFRRAGIKMEDPSPLSRVRPDGYNLEWKLAIPEANGSGVIPFLIEDETPREERVPRETFHANHVIGIKGLVIAVENLNEIAQLYTQALNSSLGPVKLTDVAAAGRRFIAGSYTFEIVSPTDSRGALACWLKERGPSIYSISLSSSQGERRSLDEHSALGARIQIERRDRVDGPRMTADDRDCAPSLHSKS